MSGQGAAYVGLSKAVPRERPFGEFRLLAKIEHSGLYEGFLAHLADRPAELRLLRRLHSHLERQPDYLAMFVEQGEVAARVEHPSAARVFERGEIGGRHYAAYEWLDGQTVRRLLEANGAEGLPLPIAVRIVDDVLEVLDAAHRSGDASLVHGEVSPDNVLVTYDGRVVLVGFGGIRPTDPRLRPELTSVSSGYRYAAPEQAKGGTVDRRVDVWSAGGLLWEMLAGRPLLNAKAEAAVLTQLLHGEIAAIDEVVPAVPKALARAVGSALCRDPDLRPATARVFLERLAHACPERATTDELAALVRGAFAADRRTDQKLLADLTGGSDAHTESASAGTPLVPSPMWKSMAILFGLIALAASLAGFWARSVP